VWESEGVTTRRRRNALQVLGLLIGSIGLSLALAEILLRLLSPSPYCGIRATAPQETFFQYDRLLGWRGVPHAAGPFRGIDFDVTVANDGNGFRNQNPPFVRGKRNLLVLGDSYGWGWGVGNADLFHVELMELDARWNVYNLSAPGYGTDQEYLALEGFLESRQAEDYEGAILLFYQNDFEDNASTRRYAYAKPVFLLSNDGELSLANVPVPRRPPRSSWTEYVDEVEPARWMNISHVYNFLSFKIPEMWEGMASRRNPSQRAAEPTSQEREAFGVTTALLVKLAALSLSRGMFLHLVILMPHNADPEAWQWDPLEKFLTERGIGHSRFRSGKLPNTDLWLDGHLAPYGHRRLASHLLDLLSSPPYTGS